ncbi:catalase [Colletotrichum orchidophilum]|uniref:Catalase n=1 Tax=Colletotrichum orchidophilum TaxID=1209926 RepID=A0A1G4ANX9_9PEZI|nr:catalase [Colletotrichum orchidophilum]OHE90874.1 catalase [Colletotrichum orchidophilum]
METVQRIIKHPIETAQKTFNMGSTDTSFAAHVAGQFSTYEEDRQTTSKEAIYSTSNGTPMPHPYEAQRCGENGPLLLQDFHLIDLLSHFDRERIPERVVHAKGSGAHGFFECTDPIPELTQADIFGTKGKKCPITVRFSTVGGESGSPDLARDPRGFSVKFRTEEGNWDMVANNTPVFFLRDPAKFPMFIHTQKRDPQTHLNHMDDSFMFWNYLSENPESIHQVMILMGDRGIPDGYRFMHGYAGHTMKLVNKDGSWVYAQIHMKSQQGTKFITQEDSLTKSADYSGKDLFEAIQNGDYPKWSVEIQTMTPKEAEDAWENDKINVFDLTHVWPQGKYPLRRVGEFTLNENPQNYFAEVEQVAFNPSHLPPGIEPSADPVLQSRLFSYPDTHRHRIGVNYQQLPVNAPKTAHKIANFQRDGSMAFFNQGARPNYLSSIDPVQFKPRAVDLDKTHGHFTGQAITFLSEIRPEDFVAPRALWQKVWDEAARERFINNVTGKMELCKNQEPLKKQIAIFREVDPEIAERLEKSTGIKGYEGIANLTFNGTHNGFAREAKNKYANGVDVTSLTENNGAPGRGTHRNIDKVVNGEGARHYQFDRALPIQTYFSVRVATRFEDCTAEPFNSMHQRETMEIPYEAVLRSLTGVAQATKAASDIIDTIKQSLTSGCFVRDNDKTENQPTSLSFEGWQDLLKQRVPGMTEATLHITFVAVAVSFLRETARQNQTAKADEINHCWNIFRGALTTLSSPQTQFAAARSAQGFLSVPLCSLVKDGSIDELFRLHVWMPDGKRGNPDFHLHSHQPFAQSWILAGQGVDHSYQVEPVEHPAEATHAEYALAWNDGKGAGTAYKTHQTSSVVQNTGKLFRAVKTHSEMHTRGATYSVPAAEFHVSEVAPDSLHATIFFFDSARGFVKDAGVLGPKDGESFTQLRDPAGVTPAELAEAVSHARLQEAQE